MSDNLTTCIVLAGGLGSRLGSSLNGLPKCLAPVGGRTFLDLQLDWLAAVGVRRFILSLGHRADAVLSHMPMLQQRHNVCSVVEPARLGTGGASLFAMHEVGLEEGLVVNGDTFFDGNIEPMLNPLGLVRGELLRLATVEVSDRSRYGGLMVEGQSVERFLEKGMDKAGPINAGLYRVARGAFGSRVPGTAFSFEQDVLSDLVAAGAVSAVAIGGSFIDIGVPEDYQRFCVGYNW